MRYSVIVPVYNASPYLDACVDSVLAQGVSDWELVLIDDGSTDGSSEKLDELARRDERIRVIHQQNKGQYLARWSGIEAATGEYLLFLDADDELEPLCLARVDEALNQSSWDIVLFTGNTVNLATGGGHPFGVLGSDPRVISLGVLRKNLLSSNDLNSLCTKAFKRGLFGHKVQLAEGLTGVRCGEDKVCLLEAVSEAKSAYYIPDALYRYVRRETSVTSMRGHTTFERIFPVAVFDVLPSYMAQWGLDDPANRARAGAYYLRSVIETYSNLRKRCKGTDSETALHDIPWREKLKEFAWTRGAERLLSPKERLKLVMVRLGL